MIRFCDHCNRTYFDSVTEIDDVLKRAYHLRLCDINYLAGLSQFTYKIDLLDELKLSIEQVLTTISQIVLGEEFALVHNGQVIVGIREREGFVIEKIINKVI